MKNYTDIEQSKKLAEILPIESADMCFINNKPQLSFLCEEYYEFGDTILQDYYPCWSLAALLVILPKSLIYTPNPTLDGYCCKNIMHDLETYGENPVDVCVEMILKLNELNEL